MQKKALITGVAGQDGAYLARLLLGKGYAVTGAVRRNSQGRTRRLDELGITGDVAFVDFDLMEPNAIARIVRDGQFDEIYNLAGQSYVGSSWNQPVYVAEVNGIGVAHLLDAIRTYAPGTRFYQASTSEMFGLVRETPQTEMTPFHPRSPYGVSKVFGHFMTMNYRESFGTYACSGILFNHESPLRGEEFVTRKITMALARIAHGAGEVLELGNLNAERDWGFAGDYVEGMWAMLQQEAGDDFVLATGTTTPIRDFVDFAAEALGLGLDWQGEGREEVARDRKSGAVIVRVSDRYFRPAEVERLIGDASKARRVLGWTPKVGVRDLAGMMAKADFDRVGRAG